jgi:hypothetical protein
MRCVGALSPPAASPRVRGGAFPVPLETRKPGPRAGGTLKGSRFRGGNAQACFESPILSASGPFRSLRMLPRGPRGVRETGGAMFGRCSEVRPQPLLGGSWLLRGGGSALTMPGMGCEAVVGDGVAYFNTLLCTTLMQTQTVLRGCVKQLCRYIRKWPWIPKWPGFRGSNASTRQDLTRGARSSERVTCCSWDSGHGATIYVPVE